ncbi:hypothetical protein [Rhizobium sp. P44RR-XXIV]|uniref:hypothetical protein n=1 Tax=Rhizobium sp. P44RR-XXIV TaxID=1921145 RepID=UPI000987A651|nr:hypothetical protein [Rhizobium sp. P44RR-XXIV]TIX91655.1 hypothetical protein BSK43_012100 [Rhizobium sp. P44RR-XXIV]
MEISAAEARHALHEVEQATLRSNRSKRYRGSAPYLILWGAIWFVGYSSMFFWPALSANLIWLVLDGLGLAGSVLIGVKTFRTRDDVKKVNGRVLAVFAIITLFMLVTIKVMQPMDAAQYAIFPALVLSLAYGLIGVFFLRGFVWLAVAVSLGSLVPYVFLQPWLSLCIAVFGGGSLLIGGVWMRKL